MIFNLRNIQHYSITNYKKVILWDFIYKEKNVFW